MNQVVILSGKGGTGKTTLAGCLAHLASQDIELVLADLDVDASNLELLIPTVTQENHPFSSGVIARINQSGCIDCGICLDACRFEAVCFENSHYRIDETFCEGCLSCFYQCPVGAIETEKQHGGEWFQSRTPYGELFHARLTPGAENSGKLVTTVRASAEEFCRATHCDFLLLDGPPGTGCPVTASVRGAIAAILVTEPTVSGLHDLERILRVVQHFGVPACLVINKSDLNLQVRRQILSVARRHSLPVLGEIPYDQRIITLQSLAKPLTEVDDSAATDAIRVIWQRLKAEIGLSDKKTGVQ